MLLLLYSRTIRQQQPFSVFIAKCEIKMSLATLPVSTPKKVYYNLLVTALKINVADDDSETYTSVIDCDDSDHDLQATESNVVVEDVAHEGSELRLRVSQSCHEDDPYAEIHTSKNVKTPRPSVIDLQNHPEEPREV